MESQNRSSEGNSRKSIGAATVIGALALAGLVWMQADEHTARRLAGGVAEAQPAATATPAAATRDASVPDDSFMLAVPASDEPTPTF